MVLNDPVVLAYAAAALTTAAVAFVTWRRRAQNPSVAATLTLVMVGGCWWSVGLAVVVASTSQTAKSIASLAISPGPSLMVVAFMCLAYCIARPQWVPRRGVVVALLAEPVLNTLIAATNPWHLWMFGGAGAAQLTDPTAWTRGWAFWVDTSYTYLEISIGLGLVAHAWWTAAPAFRGQRLVLFLAALVPVVANVAFLIKGYGTIVDPTPFGFAVTCSLMWIAIFRQDLFTFAPVARALIIDQIGDAVVVISPGGRVLDLNPAAADLLRGMNPQAPAMLVGAAAHDLFDDGIATPDGRETEIVVELAGGRAEFQVRASLLIDRYDRGLGTVFVARDVTEANNQSRRLASAHAQLIRQVETIELLRSDLVELASRDPLTGLHNRRHMVEHFASMLAAAESAGEPLAVALFDVDRFKAVNDDYGHLAGDAVLIWLAQLMDEHAPAGALVARWGGEEFFIALSRAESTAGMAFADDLRRRCEQTGVIDQGRLIRCTVSGGVAAYPTAGTTVEELFHAADAALSEAKRAGRNLVRLHQPSPTIASQAL